jgi:hypothetical protein
MFPLAAVIWRCNTNSNTITFVVLSAWCNVQLLALNQLSGNVTSSSKLRPNPVVIMNLLIQAWPQVAGPLRCFYFPVWVRKTTDTRVGWTNASKLVFWNYSTECTCSGHAIGHDSTAACSSRLRNTVYFFSICSVLHEHCQHSSCFARALPTLFLLCTSTANTLPVLHEHCQHSSCFAPTLQTANTLPRKEVQL